MKINNDSIDIKTNNNNYDIFSLWSGRQDLNLRPSGPKPDALPGCATPRLFNCLAYKGLIRNEKETMCEHR